MEYGDVIFQIILHGGNARSSAMEAIAHAKQGEMEAARQALFQAAAELTLAHQIQTDLLQREAAGETAHTTLLMVHAQDHLMNAMTVKELAQEFVEIYERMLQKGRV